MRRRGNPAGGRPARHALAPPCVHGGAARNIFHHIRVVSVVYLARASLPTQLARSRLSVRRVRASNAHTNGMPTRARNVPLQVPAAGAVDSVRHFSGRLQPLPSLTP